MIPMIAMFSYLVYAGSLERIIDCLFRNTDSKGSYFDILIRSQIDIFSIRIFASLIAAILIFSLTDRCVVK